MVRRSIKLNEKRASDIFVEFWERVHDSVLRKMSYQLDLRWRLSICIGHSNNTNQYYVALSNGSVVKGRSIERVIASRRWCANSVAKIAGIPGDMIVHGDSDPAAGGEEDIDPHAILDADLEVGDEAPEARDSKLQSAMTNRFGSQ